MPLIFKCIDLFRFVVDGSHNNNNNNSPPLSLSFKSGLVDLTTGESERWLSAWSQAWQPDSNTHMVEGDHITQDYLLTSTHALWHMCTRQNNPFLLVTLECFKATERILRMCCNSRGSFFGEGSLDVSGVNFGKIMPGVQCVHCTQDFLQTWQGR